MGVLLKYISRNKHANYMKDDRKVSAKLIARLEKICQIGLMGQKTCLRLLQKREDSTHYSLTSIMLLIHSEAM